MTEQILYGAIIIIVGFILDLIFGDPRWMPHPVVWMGKAISGLEAALRGLFSKTEKGEKVAGYLLAVIVPILSLVITIIILTLAKKASTLLSFCIEAFMCYQILATKSLKTESMAVCYELEKSDIMAAQQKLSRIVGRDTNNLSKEQVAKATIETVAENTSDGVIAPMLFIAIGGAPLGFFYKAINTMDSTVGYKNTRYLFFGKAAARLDDFANFLPSRISAMMMILASKLNNLDSKDAWRIFKRDRFCHTSPNSAQTESVCAGALGIQLGGDALYFGKPVKKPTIGDEINKTTADDIKRANNLMYTTAIICLIFCVAVRIAVLAII